MIGRVEEIRTVNKQSIRRSSIGDRIGSGIHSTERVSLHSQSQCLGGFPVPPAVPFLRYAIMLVERPPL